MRFWLTLMMLCAVVSITASSVTSSECCGAESCEGEVGLEDLDDIDGPGAVETTVASAPYVTAEWQSVVFQQWLFESGLDRPPCVRAS